MSRPLLRDAAISLSLANLLCLRLWSELFAVGTADAYYLTLTRADCAGTALAMVALAAAFAGGAQLRHEGPRAATVVHIAFGVVLVLLANNVGPAKRPGLLGIYVSFHEDPSWAPVLYSAAIALAFAAFVRWFAAIRRIAATGLLLLSPFVLVTCGRAGWHVAHGDFDRFASRAPPLASVRDGDPGPRVVVLLFDALGRRLAFENRPDGVAMPAFDRLRAQALDAPAVRRAGHHTREAVPGFLSGVQPRVAHPAGPGDLVLELEDGTFESWTRLPNAFRAAREAGGPATVAGWYHPYCRIFGADLDGCSAYPASTCGGQVEWSVPAATASAFRALVPFTMYRDRHVRAYQAVLRDALVATQRRGRGLTFVHLPVPHHPDIYDAQRRALTRTSFHPDGFRDQLVLADETLAAIREGMERAGTWDASTVLVTADHPSGALGRQGIRERDVPFLLKLPGQGEPLEHAAPFSAATGYPLVRALLRGEIGTAAEADAWLTGHAIAPAPPPAFARNHEPTGRPFR